MIKNLIKVLILNIFIILIFSGIAYSENNKIYVIKKQDFQEVDRWYAGYIKKAIDKASEDNADLIILELDTPGGLLSSALSIKNYIIDEIRKSAN